MRIRNFGDICRVLNPMPSAASVGKWRPTVSAVGRCANHDALRLTVRQLAVVDGRRPAKAYPVTSRRALAAIASAVCVYQPSQ